MRRTIRSAIWCVAVVPALLWFVERANGDAEPAKSPNGYRNTLIAALLDGEPYSMKADSAAQRLALQPPHNDNTLTTTLIVNIVDRAGRGLDRAFLRPSFVGAIASQRGVAVRQLIGILESEKLSDTGVFAIVCSLGRLGPGAADAVPVLRAKMNSITTSARLRPAMEVALANIGEVPDAFNERFDMGHNSTRKDGLGAVYDLDYFIPMSLMRPRGKWLDEHVVGRVTAQVRNPGAISNDSYSDTLRRAVIILALAELDDIRRESVLIELNSALDRAYDCESRAAFEIALAVARATPEKARPVLEKLCRRLPDLKPNGDVLPMVVAGSETAYLLVNDASSRALWEILSSDEMIADRAAAILMLSGLSGRACVPAALEFVKSDAPEERRHRAAMLLEYIADSSFVEQIKSVTDACRSLKVSDALKDAAKRILFE